MTKIINSKAIVAISYLSSVILMMTACSKEDFKQQDAPSKGILHVAEVSLPEAGMQTRVITEDGNSHNKRYMIFNQAVTSFDNSYSEFENGCDQLRADFHFGGEPTVGYLTYRGDNEWKFTGANNIMQPNYGEDKSERWEHFSMDIKSEFASIYNEAGPQAYNYIGRDYCHRYDGNNGILFEILALEYPADWIYDSSTGKFYDNSQVLTVRTYLDKLVASTSDGSITVDKDLESPALGEFSVALKHAHAMLRLPVSDITVTDADDPLVIDGKRVVPEFKMLWAELTYTTAEDIEDNMYLPLTPVTLTGGTKVYQAIVPASVEYDCNNVAVGSESKLTGFKVVYNYTEISGSTEPVKASFDVALASGIALKANTRYPLTLEILPKHTTVNVTAPTGKPGWGEDEPITDWATLGLHELSYSDNTFYVSGPSGLKLVGTWMNGDTGAHTVICSKFSELSGTSEINKQGTNITLVNDIDMSLLSTTSHQVTVGNNQETLNANWTSIDEYRGTFNGNDYTIEGLRICGGDVGLINKLYGTITNLKIEDAIVYGNVNYVGSLVAINYGGSVIGCTVIDSRIVCSAITYCYVGGIIGNNSYGNIIACSLINNSVEGYTSNQNANPLKGAVAGINDHVIISCWTTSNKITGDNKDSISACYYVAESDNDGIDGTTAVATAAALNDATDGTGPISVMNNEIGSATDWRWAVGTAENGAPSIMEDGSLVYLPVLQKSN